jgi:co-chaperonin GroES (HSP10)
MKLLGNRIMILPEEGSENKTEGGIIVPGEVVHKKGVVAEVGKFAEDDTPTVGSRVMYRARAENNEYYHNGKKHWIMREPDIICIFD